MRRVNVHVKLPRSWYNDIERVMHYIPYYPNCKLDCKRHLSFRGLRVMGSRSFLLSDTVVSSLVGLRLMRSAMRVVQLHQRFWWWVSQRNLTWFCAILQLKVLVFILWNCYWLLGNIAGERPQCAVDVFFCFWCISHQSVSWVEMETVNHL